MSAAIRGTVFLSHASLDKDKVKPIKDRLDAAAVFYDTSTISPGQASIEAMRTGVGNAAVFVLFHSPNSRTVWVDFEKELAEVARIRSRSLQILVHPIGGETYQTLPEWMKRYITTTSDYRANDVARLVRYLHGLALKDIDGASDPEPEGREDLIRKATVDVISSPARTGSPKNVVVLTGLQGMGRSTTASQLIPRAFPGMRPAGPIFDLPDAADAIDWHLRIREDLVGPLSPDDVREQIDAFNNLTPDDQAATIRSGLEHWASLNQVITTKSRWGFRDRGREMKPWLEALLRSIDGSRDLKLILISERKLQVEQVARFRGVVQYELNALSDETIEFILTSKIEGRYLRPERIPAVTERIHGHPATANHVSYLVNSGMSLESLAAYPEPIAAFQDQTLDGIFHSGALTTLQSELLSGLSWFSSVSILLIERVFDRYTKEELVDALWELNQFSLINQADGGYYSVPMVVASRLRRGTTPGASPVFAQIAELLKEQIDNGIVDPDLLDSLIAASISVQGMIPDFLKGMVTGASLLRAVEGEYNFGLESSSVDVQGHFKRAYDLAKLALSMRMPDDTLENILFYGADASVRVGEFPGDLLDVMKRRGFAAAQYIEGSYLFHKERDYDGAARKLESAVRSKHFRVRNARLLARIYLRQGEAKKALDALAHVDEQRLMRDTGLMIMKIKALRGARDPRAADELQSKLGNRENEFGDLAVFRATKALREHDWPAARRHLEDAKKAPKSNKVTLRFLECAVEVESGNNEGVAEAAELARAAGRDADAYQLQARAAVVAGDWRSAEDYLNRIERKDFFDTSVELRMLELKAADPDLLRDPSAKNKLDQQREAALRRSASAVEGGRV